MKPISYDWDFSVVWEYRVAFADGLRVTFEVLGGTIFLSVVVGLLLALFRMSPSKLLSYTSGAFIEFTRSVPSLVWVVWFYYCLPVVTGLTLDGFMTVVIALSLYTSVFFAEIFRAGLQSVDRGQIEAAQAIGMGKFDMLRRIAGPVAFIRILPPFVSQCVLTIKSTALAGYVAVGELLYQGQRISIHTFRPLEVLTAVALIFAAIILPLTLLAGRLDSGIQKKYFGR
jgi:polar amino acid transport system permease protein